MREEIRIEIDPAVLARFDSLTDARWGGPRPWAPAEDELLLEYWPRKVKADVAKALDRAYNVCLQRFRELAEGE